MFPFFLFGGTVEGILLGSPLISHAIVIGKNRPHVVALIIPMSSAVDINSLNEILEAINSRVPIQTRLYPDRVRILSPKDEFVMSPKGTVIRGKTEMKFAEVVEGMYAAA